MGVPPWSVCADTVATARRRVDYLRGRCRAAGPALGSAAMSAVADAVPLGTLLKDWRRRRRMSQLDLALEAGVSARHLSFLETGRSRPSRDMVLRLCEELSVPLRDRNGLLLAAGFAPAYQERPLEAPEMEPVRRAVAQVLTGHEPFPAAVVD